jgi:AraC-like DNA-binding protein
MQLSDSLCQLASFYLNQYATRLQHSSLSFNVYYWGSKLNHPGNQFHRHHFMELCYVLEGEGVYSNEEQSFKLEEGSLYLSSPGTHHRLEGKRGLHLLFVAFELDDSSKADGDMLKRYQQIRTKRHIIISQAQESPVVLLWKSLINQVTHATYKPLIHQLAHALISSAIIQFSERTSFLQADKVTGAVRSHVLKKAEEYIQSHLRDKLSIQEVASSLHLSERQLSRLIAEHLQQSFPSWVRTERIRHAAYLLTYTSKSIKEIADETGFETVHYFHRVFLQLLEITPGQFRKQVLNNPHQHQVVNHYLGLLVKRHQLKK